MRTLAIAALTGVFGLGAASMARAAEPPYMKLESLLEFQLLDGRAKPRRGEHRVSCEVLHPPAVARAS
jgi:hypothetical protein